MLTVKEILSNGTENVYETKKVQYSDQYNVVVFDEETIDLSQGSRVYVMNSSGSTISTYVSKK